MSESTNRRNRTAERLERIWWYIALRNYNRDVGIGKVFSAARKQADDAMDELNAGLVMPQEGDYWRWRKIRKGADQ